MPQSAPLYIIASQHPRVGKTLIARLLIEYLRLSGKALVGYDLDPREPALAAYFPTLVWPLDIAFGGGARRKSIERVVLFIPDSAPITARNYAELPSRLPQTTFVPVHNEAASFMFIPQDFPPSRAEYGAIRVPRL